jgi:hypothetical protein
VGFVAGEALVLASDFGFSALSWWTSIASLLVTVAGRSPFYAEVQCRVHRGKELIAGTVLPVTAPAGDAPELKIRWDEVPTTQQRIARGDPAIIEPERTWRIVEDARSGVASSTSRGLLGPRPDTSPWGIAEIDGWPPVDPLDEGRSPCTGLVVSSSGDPAGYRSLNDWALPCRPYAGTIYEGRHDYLGWLLLSVVSESGSRSGLHVRKRLRRDHLGTVLPVAVHPTKRHDIEIMWSYSPNTTRAATERLRAANESAQATFEDRIARAHDLTAALDASAALAGIADPVAHARTEEMLRRFGLADGESGSVLARLGRLRADGLLSDDEYRAECARLRLRSDSG